MSTNGILLLVLIKSDDRSSITQCIRFYFLYLYILHFNLFPHYFSNSLKTKASERNELTDV